MVVTVNSGEYMHHMFIFLNYTLSISEANPYILAKY
jgi:hypothetical protein